MITSAYPRTATGLAALAVAFRTAAAAVAAVARVVSGALQAAGRTADALSAVASAGGTPPPPIPTKAKTSK